MKYTLQPNTVMLLVGPSRCGKSTFAKKVYEKVFEAGLKAALLSSDSIRKGLLGREDDETVGTAEMMSVSRQAFEVLMCQLKALISHPVDCPAVIVDSTALDENFRELVKKAALDNGYNIDLVYFDYSRSEYLEGAVTDNERFVVNRHYDRFKRDFLPNIKRNTYSQITKVSKRNRNGWEELEVTVAPVQGYCLGTSGPVVVIGDVHESIEALTDLFRQLPQDSLVISVGDLFDKGGNTRGMIDWLEANPQVVRVKGNHENYLAKRLRGQLSDNAPVEIEETYFTALKELLEDEDLADRFLAIHDQMVPYVYVLPQETRKGVYVTHAPCLRKFLGKSTDNAISAVRNFRIERGASERQTLNFIFEEADNSHPWHVFGHVAHKSRDVAFKNKVFLDTGAYVTGSLTAIVFEGYRHYTLVGKGPVKDGAEALPDLLKREVKVPVRADYDLDEEEERKLRNYKRNKIRYISGTMAPAPSDATQLESLEAGLEMFRKRGCTKVVVEPKFMGSRCQVYLTRGKPEECFAASRNGYRISHVEGLSEVLAEFLNKMEKEDWWKETILIDGELLPWSALGKGLIDHSFKQYSSSISKELEVLGSDEVFQSFEIGTQHDTVARQDLLKVFDKQMEIFGGEGELKYQPFAVLSVDGTSVIGVGNEFNHYSALNHEGGHLAADLDNPADVQAIKEMFTNLTEKLGMEGIVIKPLTYKEGDIPYMKVRNENYLTLVYGYDYKLKYERLRSSKNVSGKLKVSMHEFELANSMLTATEEELKGKYCQMMFQIRKEKDLDPRL